MKYPARLDMSLEDIVFAMEAVRAPVSIFEPAFEDDNSKMLLIDTMSENNDSDMIDTILLKELLQKLDQRSASLLCFGFTATKRRWRSLNCWVSRKSRFHGLSVKPFKNLKKLSNKERRKPSHTFFYAAIIVVRPSFFSCKNTQEI